MNVIAVVRRAQSFFLLLKGEKTYVSTLFVQYKITARAYSLRLVFYGPIFVTR